MAFNFGCLENFNNVNDKPGKDKLQKKALHYYTSSQLLTSGDIKGADVIPVRVVGSEEGVEGAPGRKEGVVWEEEVYDVSAKGCILVY